MRRIYNYWPSILIALLILFPSCEKKQDGDDTMSDIPIERRLIINYEAEYTSPNGEELVANSDKEDAAAVIVEGESVFFLNFSRERTEFPGSNAEEEVYSGAYAWEFEGGDPATSDSKNRTVVYATAGKYDVKLRLEGSEDFPAKEKTFTDFVCVLPRPETDFGAETEGLNGLEFSGSDGSVKISEGESVIFTNSSYNSEGFSTNWIFEGGSPKYSSDNKITVTYDTPGKYPVILWHTYEPLDLTEAQIEALVQDQGFINDERFGIVVEDYVCVEPASEDPEALICLLSNEESNDGTLSTFIYDSQDNVTRISITRAGNLEEYTLVSYDIEGRVEQLLRFNANDELIGGRNFEYLGSSDQMVRQQEFDGDNTVVSDQLFTLGQDQIIGASWEVANGQGGTTIFDVEYGYDSTGANLTGERYEVNGIFQGRVAYTHDNQLKVLTDNPIEAFPNRFNLNNIISTTFYDANETVLASSSSIFQFNNFGRAESEERTVNGVVTNIIYTYNDCTDREPEQ